jgi:hypothetical protein
VGLPGRMLGREVGVMEGEDGALLGAPEGRTEGVELEGTPEGLAEGSEEVG